MTIPVPAGDLFSLAGQVVLVTGASRGLGWAMARAMAGQGAHVVLNGRDGATLAARCDALAAAGHSGEAAAFDVTDEAAAIAALDRIVARHGRLDTIVLNAGIGVRKPLLEMTTDDYRRVTETNLTACFVLAREAARRMVPAGRGRIILTASVMGFVARPGVAAYALAKAGLHGLTRALAVELGPQGITANAIAPGYFKTELNRPLWQDPESGFARWIEQRTPLGRWGEPDEVAGAAIFLASPAGAFVSGAILAVDGGMLANL